MPNRMTDKEKKLCYRKFVITQNDDDTFSGIRKCPNCNKEIKYKAQTDYLLIRNIKRAENKKTTCGKCYVPKEFDKKHKIVLNNKLWKGFRKCLFCNKNIEHNSEDIIILRRTIKIAIENNRPCIYCDNQKVCIENCLATTHPEKAKLIFPTQEYPLTGKDVTVGMKKKVSWKCNNGHLRETVVGNVGNCAECGSAGTSKIEKKIYHHIKKVFSNAQHRDKSFGKEIDIYLPDLKIGIEYGDSHWHANSEAYKKDLEKYNFFIKKGIQIINIRDEKCKKISEFDFVINLNKEWLEECVLNILKCIKENFSSILDKNQINKIKNFEFKEDYPKDLFNLPVIGKSLLSEFPDIAAQWDYEKNGLTPYKVSPNSGEMAYWIAPCGCSYQTTINAKAGKKAQDPFSTNRKVCEHNSLLALSPDVVLDFNEIKNGKSANEALNGSNEKFWWECHKCTYEWPARVAERTGLHKNKSKCPNCSKRAPWTLEMNEYLKELYVNNGLGALEIYNIWISNKGKFKHINRSKESIKIQLERLKLRHTQSQTSELKSRLTKGENNPMYRG